MIRHRPAGHRALALAAVSVLLLLPGSAWAARVVVFGDSWGVPAAPALQQVFDERGVDDSVAGAAVGGETANDLSKPVGLQHITDTLASHPTADLVHLSIGGNDFLGGWSAGMTPGQEDALFTAIMADIETIVDHILATRPGAHILLSSYDYPRPLPMGTPAQVNAASAEIATRATALADAKGPGLTYGDYSGLMQVTYGFDGTQHTVYDPANPIPAGDPSLPDPSLPGPSEAFTDPIHLTQDGYGVLANEHFDDFYADFVGVPAVPLMGMPATACLALAMAGGATRRLRSVPTSD